MNQLSRRRFLAGAAITAVTAPWTRTAHADTRPTPLRVTRRVIEVDGRPADVFGLVQADGQHGLVTDAGRRFHVQLVNHLADPTLVHWHGLTPPSDQDGVPHLSQPALEAGGSYEYDFLLTQPGTNWMHSHVGLQEQLLLAAPLIVRDPAEAGHDEQEVVVLLHDFTFRDPAEILAGLIGEPGMAGMDHSVMNHDAGAMAGMVPHLNDIEFDAYLANDRTLGDPEIVRVEPGGRVRLRVINGAAATNFWLDLGALAGDLVAVDGHGITPLSGNRFPLAMAQRADIRLRLPPGAGAYPILAVREGDTARTGIILATTGASIARVSDRAGASTGALDLALERHLAAAGNSLFGAAQRPVRRHVLELTGDMMGFAWGFNGRRFDHDAALAVGQGERVEIRLVNRTDMSHPIHLHGHPFQVIAIDGDRIGGAVRDTVLVPAGAAVTIAFAADNPGQWALHCHNLYHMVAGMMTSVRYAA